MSPSPPLECFAANAKTGITWCLLDWRVEGKWSAVGFCSGVIAGLVAITPGSGYVPAWAAVIYGVVGATVANHGTQFKIWFGIDDALDIFSVHALGGLCGNILTAFFAADYIAHLDGATVIQGGFLNRHWMQLAYQLADSVAGGLYSYCASWLICMALDALPGLQLRLNEQGEISGVDDLEIGEFAYDYVELTREVLADEDEARDEKRRTMQAAIDAASFLDPHAGESVGGTGTIRPDSMRNEPRGSSRTDVNDHGFGRKSLNVGGSSAGYGSDMV